MHKGTNNPYLQNTKKVLKYVSAAGKFSFVVGMGIWCDMGNEWRSAWPLPRFAFSLFLTVRPALVTTSVSLFIHYDHPLGSPSPASSCWPLSQPWTAIGSIIAICPTGPPFGILGKTTNLFHTDSETTNLLTPVLGTPKWSPETAQLCVVIATSFLSSATHTHACTHHTHTVSRTHRYAKHQPEVSILLASQDHCMTCLLKGFSPYSVIQ